MMNFLYRFSLVFLASTFLSSASWSVNDGTETELSSSASVSRQPRSTELTQDAQNQLAHLGQYCVENSRTDEATIIQRLLPELSRPADSSQSFFQGHMSSSLELNDLEIARAQFRVAQLLGDSDIQMTLHYLNKVNAYVDSRRDQISEFPKLKDWTDYIRNFDEGVNYQDQEAFAFAISSLRKAKNIAEKYDLPYSWMLSFHLGKAICIALDERVLTLDPDAPKEAISLLRQVIKAIFGTPNDYYLCESYYWIGTAYTNTNKKELAYHYYVKAAPSLEDPIQKASCYMHMGDYHYQRKEYKRSEKYSKIGLDLLADGDISDTLVKGMKLNSLRRLTSVNRELQRYDNTILYGFQALEIHNIVRPFDNEGKAIVQFEIGFSYAKTNRYELAKENLEMALSSKALPAILKKAAEECLTIIDKMQKNQRQKKKKPGLKQAGSSNARPTITFDTTLEAARNQAKLQGEDYASAEAGIASLEKLMRNTKHTKLQRNNARIAWMEATIVLAEAYQDKGMSENIIGLFKGKEDDLKGKDALAKKCRTLFAAAQKSEAKGKAPAVEEQSKRPTQKKSKKKENQPTQTPVVFAPEVKPSGNPYKAQSRTNSSSSKNDSCPNRSRSESLAARTLIRQDSLRMIGSMEDSEELDPKKMTEQLLRKYGEGARNQIVAEVNKRLFLTKLGLRKKKKYAPTGEEQPTFKVVFARPGLDAEVPSEQRKKFDVLLEELKRDPREGRGKPETLTGNLQGHMSRKLNKEHRLIYTIDDENRIVTIVNVSGHYGD